MKTKEEAKVISIFNHKGGVAKTTIAYNLAWSLTNQKKRVLLVDGDSQCNLTALVLSDNFNDYYEKDETKSHNIKDGVRQAFDAKPEPIKAIECPNHTQNKNLFLIPGHMDLSAYEPQLNLALTTSATLTTLQNLPGAFAELIRLCSEQYSIDYVIIDLNPSLSAINQVLFMSSDAFIVPTNPDPFSIMALKTLKIILPRWKKQATELSNLTKEASYPLPDKKMYFIGEVISRFAVRNAKPAAYYRNKITSIKKEVKEDLVPALQKEGMIKNMQSEFCLTEIKDFGGLQQTATEKGVPIIALTNNDLGQGVVHSTNIVNKDLFVKNFNDIATPLLTRI
ncbi:MAG: AAA family ATPase [Elusimicrobiota bacterium]|jgi:cellulose biosynthesis protein BcsQ|nr:AAA family ATPase [Elusimicrobiota bacterium]